MLTKSVEILEQRKRFPVLIMFPSLPLAKETAVPDEIEQMGVFWLGHGMSSVFKSIKLMTNEEEKASRF